MPNTARRIPLWIIGTITSILVIGLIGIFLWFIFGVRSILLV